MVLNITTGGVEGDKIRAIPQAREVIFPARGPLYKDPPWMIRSGPLSVGMEADLEPRSKAKKHKVAWPPVFATAWAYRAYPESHTFSHVGKTTRYRTR